MRFIVRGHTRSLGNVRVVAEDPTRALEAARLMVEQDLLDITIEEHGGTEQYVPADFARQHGLEG